MEYRIGVKDVIIFIFLMGLFVGPVLAGIDTVTDRINVNFLRLYSGSNFNITDTSGNLLLLFDGASWVLYDNGAVTANFSYSNTTLNTTVLSLLNTDIAMRDNKWIGLGGAAGRIEFDDLETDEINILSAKVRIDSIVNITNLLSVQGYVRVPLDTSLSAVALFLGTDDATKGGIRFEGLAGGATVPANSNRTVDIYGASKLILGDNNDDVSLSADSLFVESSNSNVGVNTTTPNTFKVEVAGSIGPSANNTYDLGSAARRWRDIYTQGAVDVGEIREAYPFSVEPDVGDVVAVDTVNSTKDMLRKAINMSDIVRGVFAKHGYWANDTTYTYDENGTAINATNISIWIEPRVAKFGLFTAKVNGTVKKGDYLLCCTSPGVLGSIRTVSIRSQVLVVHPIYAWLYTNYPAVVASWTPEQIRVLSLGLPTVGIAMEDYNSDMIGMISVDLMPQ